jgi:hypothetical protein
MTKESYDKAQEIIFVLMDWINRVAKEGATSEEIAVLPEVIRATTELLLKV